MSRGLVPTLLPAVILSAAVLALAQEEGTPDPAGAEAPPPATARPQAPAQAEPVPAAPAKPAAPVRGRDLMTPEERQAHRAAMRSLKTEEERELYRRQHHEEMKRRAAERGIPFPDEPLPRAPRQGTGRGEGRGRGLP